MARVYANMRFLVGDFTEEEVEDRGTMPEGWEDIINGKEILFGEGELDGICIEWR